MKLEINEEESVIIHNAVIFMANDLMDDIQELEAHILMYPYSVYAKVNEEELKERRRRWDVMMKLTERVKNEA